jgi:hypothetical protein
MNKNNGAKALKNKKPPTVFSYRLFFLLKNKTAVKV